MSIFFRSWFWIGFFVALIAYKCYGQMKVAVVDTGLNLADKRFEAALCPTGHMDFTGLGLNDTDGHGTHVVGLIKRNAGPNGYCIVVLKFYADSLSGRANQNNCVAAIEEAIRQNVNIINLSGGGTDLDERELLMLKQHPEILLIGAAGNEGSTTVRNYPGCLGLSNTRCVGALNSDGTIAKFSNKGPWVNAWQPGVNILSTIPNGKEQYMSGTSMSTAIETGLEIKRRLEHALHRQSAAK